MERLGEEQQDSVEQAERGGGRERGAQRDEVGKGNEENAFEGSLAKLRTFLSHYHIHIIAVIFAVGCPILVNATALAGEGMPGVALLPALYMVQWIFHRQFYGYMFLLPIPILAMFVINNTWGPSGMWGENPGADVACALLPSVAFIFNYAAVYAASRLAKHRKKSIDAFCHRISDLLLKLWLHTDAAPNFMYVKRDRVLPSLAAIFKLLFAIAMIITSAAVIGTLDVFGCSEKRQDVNPAVQRFAWINFAVLCFEETLFHCCIYLPGNFRKLKVGIWASFAERVVTPTYWEWYIMALFAPTQAIWLPITLMWLRLVPNSFANLFDGKGSISKAMFSLDLALGIVLLCLHLSRSCYIPHALIYRQLSLGLVWLSGFVGYSLKNWKLVGKANEPVTSCKIYIPVGHSEIDCAPRKWMCLFRESLGAGNPAFPETVDPIDLPCCKCGTCSAVYYPENTLKIKRKEFRIGFDTPWNDRWVEYERETVIPGAWVVITANQSAGIKMSGEPLGTGLEGQFRIIHLLENEKCLQNFGEFDGTLFVAKKYKKDPQGGLDLDFNVDGMQNEAEKMAMHNRHQRSLKIYFQDALTAEKVAEFGRQFNKTPKLSFRKVEVMRSVVMELDCDALRPSLYVVERYLEDDAPFQKFNNNDYVPGQFSSVQTPNMFSLFSYIQSEGKYLICDVQGKNRKFTDMQIYTSTDFDLEDEDSLEASSASRDWLQGDGGVEMQKRVLVGLLQQRELQRTARKLWRYQMIALNRKVALWNSDPAFAQMIRNLERQAIMFRYYFQALNPVMTSNTGATYVDQEDDLYAKIDGFQDSAGALRGHTTTGLGPTTTLSFGAYGRESTVALDALHHHSSSSCSCFSCFSLFRHKWRGNIKGAATPMTGTPFESRLQSHASSQEVSQNHSAESEIQASANAPTTKPVPLVNQVQPSIPAKDEDIQSDADTSIGALTQSVRLPGTYAARRFSMQALEQGGHWAVPASPDAMQQRRRSRKSLEIFLNQNSPSCSPETSRQDSFNDSSLPGSVTQRDDMSFHGSIHDSSVHSVSARDISVHSAFTRDISVHSAPTRDNSVHSVWARDISVHSASARDVFLHASLPGREVSSGSMAPASNTGAAESANDSSQHGSAADPVQSLGDTSRNSSQLSIKSTVVSSVNSNVQGCLETERISKRFLEPMPLEVGKDFSMINSMQEKGVSQVAGSLQEAADDFSDGIGRYARQDIAVHEGIEEEEEASRWSSMASSAFGSARISPETGALPGKAAEANLEVEEL